MKIISLNLAGRSNFGKDFDARMRNIAKFLDAQNADIVCMQEVTFDNNRSLAERINSYLENPYPFVESHMSEKYTFDKFSPRFLEKWNAGLIEHIDDWATDGMAVFSKEPIANCSAIVMKPAPADERGKPDLRVRVSLIVTLESGFTFANVHFATNGNAFVQLKELIDYKPTDVIVGDFNMFTYSMKEHADIWQNLYKESTDFKDYISFPDENATFDHMLIKPAYTFKSIETVDGLSDHVAMVYEIEKTATA